MKFRTEIFPENFPKTLNIRHEIFSIGSCFAVHMAERLDKMKHPVLSNPFGVLFNPISIAKSLRKIHFNDLYSEDDLIQFNDLWLSLDHHGAFNHTDKLKCLEQINEHIVSANKHLRKTKHLIITFGSAWVYEYLDSKSIVANCHKIPQNNFRNYCLNPGEIAEHFSELFEVLLSENQDLQIILSVSPVRHWKDGAEENGYGKSVLRVACETLKQNFDAVNYFPAYEILLDDLRDYRFYKSDLLHPSQQAIDYIWDKFKGAAMDDETASFHNRIQSIITRFQHQPIHEGTTSYEKFTNQLLADIRDLESECEFLKFEHEKELLIPKISS